MFLIAHPVFLPASHASEIQVEGILQIDNAPNIIVLDATPIK
jgi:hypothetical protein